MILLKEKEKHMQNLVIIFSTLYTSFPHDCIKAKVLSLDK